MWLRLAREFDAVYVDEPLVRIRIDSDGLTRNTLRLHADNLRVLAKWRRAAAENTVQRRMIRHNMHASHHALARCYWAARQPWRALQHRVLSLASEFL